MPHHTHSCGSPHAQNAVRTYVLLGFVSIGIGLVEYVGSVLSGSVSLLSDTLHVASDAAGFFIAAYAEHRVGLSHHSGDEKARISIRYMRVIGILLLLSLVWPLIESLERFSHPVKVFGTSTAAVALFGLCANYVQHRYVPGHNHHGKMQAWHIISDMITNVAVIASGIAVWWTGRVVIDPIISIGIIAWIGIWTLLMMVSNKNSFD